jgi:hypothetical protein
LKLKKRASLADSTARVKTRKQTRRKVEKVKRGQNAVNFTSVSSNKNNAQRES